MNRSISSSVFVAVLGLVVAMAAPAAEADNVSTATGSSYAVKISGPVTISSRPVASVKIPVTS